MSPITAVLARVLRRGGASKRPPQRSLREWTRLAGRAEYAWRKYDDEAAARQAVAVVEEHTMASYERLVTLWQQVRHLDRTGVSGSLVECGTWKGGSCGMMALAHLSGGTATRRLHMFDSFEGLPEPDPDKDGAMAQTYVVDKAFASGALESIGHCVGTREENQALLERTIGYPASLLTYHVGWFQNTVPVAAPSMEPIALLRLDGDWYASTKVCLEHLAPRVVPGGIVVLDDYGKWPGCRQATDEYVSALPRPPFLNHIDASGRYWIVP